MTANVLRLASKEEAGSKQCLNGPHSATFEAGDNDLHATTSVDDVTNYIVLEGLIKLQTILDLGQSTVDHLGYIGTIWPDLELLVFRKQALDIGRLSACDQY